MLRRRTPLRAHPETTRAFLARGRRPLARMAAPKRRVRLAPRGKKAPERFRRAFLSPDFVRWVHSLGCAVPSCQRTDIECAHVVRPRSRGGRWYEIAPLCGPHHREQEKRTPAFNLRYGVDLESIAAAVAQRWMQGAKDRS